MRKITMTAENGKVCIVFPVIKSDIASGYPYDSNDFLSMKPEEAQELYTNLPRIIEATKKQRDEIKTAKREKLEIELKELDKES